MGGQCEGTAESGQPAEQMGERERQELAGILSISCPTGPEDRLDCAAECPGQPFSLDSLKDPQEETPRAAGLIFPQTTEAPEFSA